MNDFNKKLEAILVRHNHYHDIMAEELLTLFAKFGEELINEAEFKLNIDEYLPLVKRWNGSNYDVPFDDGFNCAKSEIRKRLQEMIGGL